MQAVGGIGVLLVHAEHLMMHAGYLMMRLMMHAEHLIQHGVGRRARVTVELMLMLTLIPRVKQWLRRMLMRLMLMQQSIATVARRMQDQNG